jgi:thymidylate synthase (FAD)
MAIMKLIDSSYEIAFCETGVDLIEKCARTCYKSEASNNGDEEKTKKFVKGLIKRGHEAMLEHSFLSVKFTTDRGVSHEIVRNRLFSFAQESTRYCNYNKDDDIVFIKPYWYDYASPNDKMIFEEHLEDVEKLYNYLIEGGHKPQEARAILPNCLKTEIVVSGNYREWRHFLKLRAANSTGPAHPDMNKLVCPLLIELHDQIPVIFDDVYEMMLDDKDAAKWIGSFKV